MHFLEKQDILYDPLLRDLLIEVAKTGAVKALVSVDKLSPYMSKSDAYRMYGRSTVDKWIKMGILRIMGEENEKQRIDRVEINAIASSSSLANYINSQYFKSQARKININEAYEKLKTNK